MRTFTISPHTPTSATRTEVERMAACGLDESSIAYCLQIDPVVLKNCYHEELTFGLARVTANAGGKLLDLGMKGNVKALMFFLGARAQWLIPRNVEKEPRDLVPDAERAKAINRIMDLVKKGMATEAEVVSTGKEIVVQGATRT